MTPPPIESEESVMPEQPRPTPQDRAAAEREAYLRRVVDSIPPMTPEQRARITALLQPAAREGQRSGEGRA